MNELTRQQARALGDPTRFAIFRAIADAGRPVGVGELTRQFALNHNAVRQHLARLVDARLIAGGTAAPSGPGRPRLVYEIAAGVHERWGAVGPYERLSGLLAEALTTGMTPRATGRAATSRPRESPTLAGALAEVRDEMSRHGFEPEVRATRGGADVVLHNCPFAATAVQHRETVCSLHLGIAEGLCDGTPLAVRELVARDPRRAGCRLVLGEAPAAPAEPLLTFRGTRR